MVLVAAASRVLVSSSLARGLVVAARASSTASGVDLVIPAGARFRTLEATAAWAVVVSALTATMCVAVVVL